LPLAAVVIVAIVGGYVLLESLFARHGTPENIRRSIEATPVAVVIVIFGLLTLHRNEDYRSLLAMWSDVVAKRPDNPRAHHNLGSALYWQGRLDDAIAQYLE